MSTEFKRRYGFLFRPKRDARVYQFPAVKDMTPEEIDREIKLRIESLQRQGKIERVETPTAKQQAEVVPLVPPKKEQKDEAFKSFRPKYFVKRS
jgi:hypothetical protein